MKINWIGGYKDVILDDSSFRLRKIMGENSVDLKFSLSEFIEFPLGAFIDYEGQQYILNQPQSLTEINSTNFEYSLVFGGKQHLLNNFKIKDVDGRLKFPFTAKPAEHVQLIVDVLNANDTGWNVGECLENNEKLVSYNHTNCFDALRTLASEFDTEYEINDKTINLRKVSYNELDPLALSYGRGNGFVSGVGRKNERSDSGFTTLYIQGGERNIDLSKYGSKDLLLPKNKLYTYKGQTYITDAEGLSISKSGVIIENKKEESLDLTNIYPQRTGTISSVIVADAEKNFYDFIDASIPESLNFSELRMNGEKITILFESGKLAGREFDIEQSDTLISGYVHAERKFKLVPKEEDGYTMPNDIFTPAIGDKYAVFGMMLPSAYISDDATQTGSSWEMFKKAAQYFYDNEGSKFTFTGELDGIWSKKDWSNIGKKVVVGGFVLFSDSVFQPAGIKIRIVSIKDYLNNPHAPTIELSNSVQSGSISSVLDGIKQNEVVAEVLHKNSLDFTRRKFRDAQETLKLLQAANLDFDSSINPITVETMSLLVGDKSLQFRFVDARLNEISHAFTYDLITKKFKTNAGTIQHLTIGIDALAPNPKYKKWVLPSYSSVILSDPKISYYVYIKASKTAETAVLILSETAIKLEGIAGYYHLLTGILNTEYEGARSFAKMYGFTEILPGQIKVDKLTSGNGLQVIELLEDQIKINAKVTFTNDSPAIDQIAEVQDPKILESQAAAKAYSDSKLALQKTIIKAYADGIVTAEEQRAIADANNKMNLAKDHAEAQDDLLKVTTDAYADGKITASENATIALAQAQANLAQTRAQAHADGIVTAEESARLLQATNDLNTAKAYAEAQADAVQVGGRNYFKNSDRYYSNSNYGLVRYYFGDISPIEGELYTITMKFSVGSDRSRISAYSSGGYKEIANFYEWKKNSEGIQSVTFPMAFYDGKTISDGFNFIEFYQMSSNGTSSSIIEWVKFERGTKATDWTPAVEDVADDIIAAKVDAEIASKAYSDSKNALAKINSEAYADGIVTAEEQRAIADATNKMNLAKDYAKAQDVLIKTTTDAYADGKITASESATIAAAQAQANLAQTRAQAHADGIVDAEEAERILQAINDLNTAKAYAEAQADAIQVGGTNMMIGSKLKPDMIGAGSASYNSDGTWNATDSTSYNRVGRNVIDYIVGQEYTFSIKIKRISGSGGQIMAYFNAQNHYVAVPNSNNIGSEWIILKLTRTIVAYNTAAHIHIYLPKGVVKIEYIKVEKGNKATDWTPAPKEVDSAISGAQTAAEAYTRAQNALLKTTSEAYADGIVTAEESARIRQATNDLNTAKAYVDAIRIGGRNLIQKSRIGGTVIMDKFGGNNANVKSTSFRINPWTIHDVGYYSISFWAKSEHTSSRLNFDLCDQQWTSMNITNEWSFHKYEGLYVDSQYLNQYYNGFLDIALDRAGKLYIGNLMLETGSKCSDYKIAPEDLEDRIDFLGETKVDGSIIATGRLGVGNGNGANAFISGEGSGSTQVRFCAGQNWANRFIAPFRVLEDGTLYASKAIIEGEIKAKSGTVGSWIVKDQTIESVAKTSSGSPKIVLNSTNGSITLRNNDNKVSVINDDGILSNAGDVRVISSTSGITGKASVGGLGFGNVSKDYMDENFLAGVYGVAYNSNGNPSRTYGGYFIDLYAQGLNYSVDSISRTGNRYTLNQSIVYLSCYNTNGAYVYLTSNPQKGLVHYIKRLEGSVTVYGGRINIATHNIVSSINIPDGDCWVFIYDGTYWCGNAMTR
jgi:methionyl-tRNA formyltransferase